MKPFLILISLILISSFILAVECPFGEVNDTYPGDCARYIDENNDGYCDLSQDLPSQDLPSTINQLSEEQISELQENN